MPAVCLMVGALFIKACAQWYQLQENPLAKGSLDTSFKILYCSNKQAFLYFCLGSEEKQDNKDVEDEKDADNKKNKKKSKTEQIDKIDEEKLRKAFEHEISSDIATNFKGANYLQTLVFFVASHILGVALMNIPQNLSKIGLEFGYNTELSIFGGFGAISAITLLTPLFVRVKDCRKTMTVLNILSLLELGTALICVAMNNFSLALYAAVIYTPLALLIGQARCR